VFITECELDNTDMFGTRTIERRNVSGVRTHRTVKFLYIHKIVNFETVVRTALLVLTATVYSSAALKIGHTKNEQTKGNIINL